MGGPDEAPVSVQHDPQTQRFFVRLEGGEARLSYRMAGEGKVDFHSTHTDPELRGRGLAGTVVEAGFEWARREGLRVLPSCPYVASWVASHPGYRDLVEP